MKILACVYGEIRGDINYLITNINKNFKGDIDFLISTWNNQKINEELFKYIILSDVPTDEYLNNIGFPYTQQIKGVEQWHNLRIGHYSQFYHIYKISNFIENNELNYDVLLISRSDLVFETNFNFNFSLDTCFIPDIYWASKNVGINDHFICGNYQYLKKSIKILEFKSFFEVIETSWNPETVKKRLLEMNNSNYYEFDCNSYILLPDRKMK
jgi:hypothetical protein